MTDTQQQNLASKAAPETMKNIAPKAFTEKQWNNIDTVLLDMDGTLLDLHFDNYFWLQFMPAKYAELFGVEDEEAHQILKQASSETQGTLNWYCLDYWSERLSMPVEELKQ